MIDIIAFDADDTLWHNENLYTQAKDKFTRLLADYPCAEMAAHKLNEIELRNLEFFGYGIKSFTLSMVEAAIELSGGQIGAGDIQTIVNFARDMLAARVDLIEQAEETLVRLSASHKLMLITKGDSFEQARKIKRSGLAQYFRYIEIVSDKTTASYQEMFEKYNITPQRFLMVGNSLRSDIFPVVAIGGRAVYIPHPDTWVHETMVEHRLGEDEYFELDHLGQLPALVERLNTW